MKKIYKGKDINFRRMSGLFATQVISGVLPVILLIIFIVTDLYSKYTSSAFFFIFAMAACSVVNVIATKRYNILVSGFHGEKALKKAIKNLKGDYQIFFNVPVRYKRNRSEIDGLIISTEGIFIIEVKNHSGTIFGHFKDQNWNQRKSYKDKRITENQMYNPLRQIRIQREIVKSILRSNGYDVWIENLIFFSNPLVRLKLTLREYDYIFTDKDELADFIQNHKSSKKLTKKEVGEISLILKSLL